MFLYSKHRLHREMWYVNAGILSEPMYALAMENVSTQTKKDNHFHSLIFLSLDNLVRYFELLSINPSKLLINTIKKHLHFLENLASPKSKKNRFISSTYWDFILTVIERYSAADDAIDRQFCIDAIERICIFLTSRSRFWVQSQNQLTLLKIYGRNTKSTVVYNSFLIPNYREYKEVLGNPKQKIFEKIENECYCKINLNFNDADCRIGEHNMVLEVLFDYYKGNFVGFLDCLSYVVKRMSPTKYFIRSLRTITQSDNSNFTILSDVPFKELILIEKVAHIGEELAPFLQFDAVSKNVFRLLCRNIQQTELDEIEKSVIEYEDLDYWTKQLSEEDLKNYKSIAYRFILDFRCWTQLMKAWNEYKKRTFRLPKRNFSTIENVFETNGTKLSSSKSSLNKKVTDDDTKVNDFHIKKPVSNFEDKIKIEFNSETVPNETLPNISFPNEISPNETFRNEISSNEAMQNEISPNEIAEIVSPSKTSSTISLEHYFDELFDRKYHFKDEPNNFLNHTLRVMLRCFTEYEAGDAEIALLDKPICTIHDLLKQYYNFDLKKGLFYTVEERKMSMQHRESARKKEKVKALERQQYLENRRLIDEQIEKAMALQQPSARSVYSALEEDDESSEIEVEVEPSKDTEYEERDESVSLDKDFLFADYREHKELLSPEFKKEIFSVFGQLHVDILQLFNEKRITQLSVWMNNIKGKKERFETFLPVTFKPLHCNVTETFKAQIKQDQIEMIYTSVSSNVYVCMKHLSGNEINFDTEFPKVLNGKGMQINFLNEINKNQVHLPRFLLLMDKRQKSFRKQLNHVLCVMSFDIYMMCASLSSSLCVVFEQHYAELKAVIESSKTEIQELFKLFEFQDKLDEARIVFKVRFMNRSKEEIGVLIKLSLDLIRFNKFLTHLSCCKWQHEKCIRIIYASMTVDGNRRCQEPFLRQGGDRRLKKIETKGNCLITMRLITHPTTGVNIPFVEIYYDFFKGNHFCTIDMLRSMFSEDRGSTARMTNLKHLICLPYGELWVIQDLEWLKTRADFMFAQDV